MRMWNVDPKLMCHRHILGEHQELHIIINCIKNGRSLKGYIDNGLIETHAIILRHEQLVQEFINRGWVGHKTPINKEIRYRVKGKIDIEKNIEVLKERCELCRERIKNNFKNI